MVVIRRFVCARGKCEVVCKVAKLVMGTRGIVTRGTLPLRLSSSDAGEASRLKFAGDDSFLLDCGGRGDASVVVGSENTSEGVSRSGVKAACGCAALGGKAGSDLSTFGAMPADGGFFDFLRRRAMSDSWQVIQKIPCDVRAYRRFSILRLQFLHRKQFAQKAWSPVRIAKSSILFPQ